jgi:serine/threonine protein kinase
MDAGPAPHPNIAVADFGFADNDRPYYITEWLQRADLAHVLRTAGPLTLNSALAVATGIAAGLEYVHSRASCTVI